MCHASAPDLSRGLPIAFWRKFPLLSTALKDLTSLTWDHLPSSRLFAFPWLVPPSSCPTQRTTSFFALVPDHVLLPSSLTKSVLSQLFWTIFPLGRARSLGKMEQNVWERPDPCFSSMFCGVRTLRHCLVSSTVYS